MLNICLVDKQLRIRKLFKGEIEFLKSLEDVSGKYTMLLSL